MASPQIENGYTRVANELLEALARAPLNGLQARIVMAVLRETYGRPGSPSSARLSVRDLCSLTGGSRSRVAEALRSLIASQVIGEVSAPEFGGRGRHLAINKDHDMWCGPKRDCSPKRAQWLDSGLSHTAGRDCSPIRDGTVARSGTVPASKPAPQAEHRAPKDKKDKKDKKTKTPARPASPKRAARTEGDPNVKRVIDTFSDTYVVVHGCRPVIHGAKDGAHVKRALKQIAADELVRIVEHAVRSGDEFYTGLSVILSATSLNRLRAAMRKRAPPSGAAGRGPTPEPIDWTNPPPPRPGRT